LRFLRFYNISSNTTKIDKINETGKFKDLKLPPKELPTGVLLHPSGKPYAYIKINKAPYHLGTFETIEEAEAQYLHYKKLAQKEKRTGEKLVNWDSFRMENTAKKFTLPEPPKNTEHRHVYPTDYHTYRVRIVYKKKTHNVGIFDTIEEAVAARDKYIKDNNMTINIMTSNNLVKDLPPIDRSIIRGSGFKVKWVCNNHTLSMVALL
jgi:hypothetical protein